MTVPVGFVPAPFFVGLTIPAHLAATSVATALAPSSAIAPAVVSLARGGMKMLIAAKMKLVAVVVLMMGVMVGVGGVVVAQSFGKGEGPKVVAADAPAASAPTTIAAGAQSSVVSGRVLDAAGKPMGDAFVSIVEWGRADPVVVASTRSGCGGRVFVCGAVTCAGERGGQGDFICGCAWGGNFEE